MYIKIICIYIAKTWRKRYFEDIAVFKKNRSLHDLLSRKKSNPIMSHLLVIACNDFFPLRGDRKRKRSDLWQAWAAPWLAIKSIVSDMFAQTLQGWGSYLRSGQIMHA